MKQVRETMREARRRLKELGLPTDPLKRWTKINRKGDVRSQVDARLAADVDQLYAVITFGQRALAAHEAGDWAAYTDALLSMKGADISSRLPQIERTISTQMQSKRAAASAAKRRTDKEKARELYKIGRPTQAKELETICAGIGIKKAPKTFANWFATFSNSKKDSR